jgi:HAE1 family hydrophobic/amphiphilic exporter-1
MAQRYKGVIAWALDHRAAVVVMSLGTFIGAFALPSKGLPGIAVVFLGIAVAVFGLVTFRNRLVKLGALAAGIAIPVLLLPAVPQFMNVGFGFFPEDDNAELNINVETPPGSNLDYTRLKSEEVARRVMQHPEVRYIYTTLGGGDAGAVDIGRLYVKLVPKEDRSLTVEPFAAVLRDELAEVGGATVAVFANDWGGGRKQVMIEVRGNNTPELNAFAQQALTAVRAVPGAVDVSLSSKGQRPELNVELNRGLAGSLGITVGQVAQALRPAFSGLDAGDWQDPSGEMRDVVVRLSPEARRRASDLRQLPLVVQGANGAPTTLPLGQVAAVSEGLGPAVINHLNRDRVVNVEFNTSVRSMGEVTRDAMAAITALQVPEGIRVTEGGEAQQQGEVFEQIFIALGIAVGLMYLILVMQFQSFLDPLAIMLSLPLSLIGVFLALSLTRNTINIMSLIGVILLMGIVAKNAILLIDFAKWAREKDGMPLREALIEAGAIRLRPILMTTFALIAGMVPTALGSGEGSQFRSPLGVAVIGGVITSTFLTLIAIPTFYEVLDEMRTWFARRLGFNVSQKTAEHRTPGLVPQSGD